MYPTRNAHALAVERGDFLHEFDADMDEVYEDILADEEWSERMGPDPVEHGPLCFGPCCIDRRPVARPVLTVLK
jgi:hypothetical protein